MRNAVAGAVGDYYRESNARLSELIGIDLAEYGYDLPAKQDATSAAGRHLASR
jgi:hypothetical protein